MTLKQELAASVLTDLLFEEPGVGRCLVAPDGSVLRANREWLRSTGFSEDDVLGADIVELFPATRDMALAMHARVRAGHRGCSFAHPHVTCAPDVDGIREDPPRTQVSPCSKRTTTSRPRSARAWSSS